jgi:hypothetical protein
MNKKNTIPAQSHEWLGVEQVYTKLGGLIGIHEVRRLMKENHIVSWWVRRSLMTSVQNVESWMKNVENSPRAATHCGVRYIVPVSALQAQ